MTVVSEELEQISLLNEFKETRNRTLNLVKNLEKDDFAVQTAPYMSPPKWHLGHVSWLYEVILSKVSENYEFYSRKYSEYLNSYYQQFGKPHDKDKRGIISRPTVDEIIQYFHTINKRVVDFLEKEKVDNKIKNLFIMGFNHECQHQELLADAYQPVLKNTPERPMHVSNEPVKIDGGLYTMGYSGQEFCYDIELPEHQVYLNDFKIDSLPVSNGDYLKFIEDGGYENFKLWLSDGWEKVKENEWIAPMYWLYEDDQWKTHDFLGKRKINPNEPVCHVSFYEADAYCRWSGKRLPTEAEWEKAACWDEKNQRKTLFPWGDERPTENHANLLESYIWNAVEVGSFESGKSHYGCYQMIGDVWEWTSSEFVGYPGFKSGFDEYNDKWFTNQKVLRGGSFGTPKMSIRASYRNFFRLDERWLFSGFRCAEDI